MTAATHLNYKRSGHGPNLIILHGLFGDLDNFQSIALHLERYLTVWRFDMPGHGRSGTLDKLDYPSMARAIHATLEREGLHDYHLLGHSLGGKAALQLAGLTEAPMPQSLIVVDIAPRAYPPHHQPILDALSALDLSAVRDRRTAEVALRDSIADAGVRAFLLKSLERRDNNEWGWRFDLKGLSRDYTHIQRAPTPEREISCPTLFIKGGKSDYLLPEDEPAIRRLVSDPQLRVIEGAGHWLHGDKPGMFSRVVLDFLSQASGGQVPAPERNSTRHA